MPRLNEKRKVIFPVSEAIRFSLESVKRRFGRVLITLISIIFGIAFYAAINTTAILNIYYEMEQGLPTTGIKGYQLWMAAISLLVCGIGIINTMLMSIAERYKEIGTLKCLGAMDKHVMMLFIIEALFLGIIGGLLGSVLGWSIGVGMAIYQNQLPTLWLSSIRILGEAMVISIILSVISAVAPAYFAAKLKPAEALRYEV